LPEELKKKRHQLIYISPEEKEESKKAKDAEVFDVIVFRHFVLAFDDFLVKKGSEQERYFYFYFLLFYFYLFFNYFFFFFIFFFFFFLIYLSIFSSIEKYQ